MRLVWTSWEVSFRAKSGNASEWAGRPQACRFFKRMATGPHQTVATCIG
jgi:hypothetical protein